MNELNLKERIKATLMPLLLYSIFTTKKQLISVVNLKFDYALPEVNIYDDNIILILDFEKIKIEFNLIIEKKENNRFLIKEIL